MKKAIRSTTSKLKLDRQHIRSPTPTDLEQVIGGERPTGATASCVCQSNTLEGTCS